MAFPNMKTLFLAGLCEWEEWDWEVQGEDESADAVAMPALELVMIRNCKLRCLPPGLASSKRHYLRELELHELSNLTYIALPETRKLPSVPSFAVGKISGTRQT